MKAVDDSRVQPRREWWIPTSCICLLAACGCTGATPRTAAVDAAAVPAAGPNEAQVRSLLGKPLHALPPGPQRSEFERKLAHARAELDADPDDPARLVWVGRYLGYLWRIPEALGVYTDGIERFPEHPELYRHRGHRYITARRFAQARADLEHAGRLLQGRPPHVEQDGLPNARNIPLTTTAFNTWYHLGLAHYLQGNFQDAVTAFREARRHARDHDDNIVATADWTYMSLRRMGQREAADQELQAIHPAMDIIENHAYYNRVLMYKGMKSPEDLLGAGDGPLDNTTLAYGVGNWYLCEGREDQARAIFERILDSAYWPAFGFIAAEADMARLRDRRD